MSRYLHGQVGRRASSRDEYLASAYDRCVAYSLRWLTSASPSYGPRSRVGVSWYTASRVAATEYRQTCHTRSRSAEELVNAASVADQASPRATPWTVPAGDRSRAGSVISSAQRNPRYPQCSISWAPSRSRQVSRYTLPVRSW